VTPASFKLAFPTFATVDDAEVNRQITRSLLFLSPTRFDAFFDEAQGNLVAHLIAMSNKDQAMGIQGRAGDATYKSAGGVNGEARVERAADGVMMQMRDPMMRTQYGQRYCWIRDMVGLGGVAAGPDSC
jgi:hypothetical protein